MQKSRELNGERWKKHVHYVHVGLHVCLHIYRMHIHVLPWLSCMAIPHTVNWGYFATPGLFCHPLRKLIKSSGFQ